MRSGGSGPGKGTESFAGFLDSVSRFAVLGGAIALVIGLSFLLYTYFVASGGAVASVDQIEANARTFGMFAMVGALALTLGVAWMLWGEDTNGPLLLIGGLLLFLAPVYLPMIQDPRGSAGVESVLSALRTAGIAPVVVGLVIIIIDIVGRLQLRAKEGSRSESLRFGKGMKEEHDIRNVFFGKCWQLPYCRKFVRERCPIYHSRKTCWRERVGCMCEEAVIRNAMEGKVIPANAVAAAKYIPVNNKLTAEQKAERCRQCVIYNERQKHKYKLAIPVSIAAIAGLYVAFHRPMSAALLTFISGADEVVQRATFSQGGGLDLEASTFPYHEVVLAILMFVLLAYVVKFVEYLIFNLKV